MPLLRGGRRRCHGGHDAVQDLLDDLTRSVFVFLQRNPQYGSQSGFKVTLSAILGAYHCAPEK